MFNVPVKERSTLHKRLLLAWKENVFCWKWTQVIYILQWQESVQEKPGRFQSSFIVYWTIVPQIVMQVPNNNDLANILSFFLLEIRHRNDISLDIIRMIFPIFYWTIVSQIVMQVPNNNDLANILSFFFLEIRHPNDISLAIVKYSLPEYRFFLSCVFSKSYILSLYGKAVVGENLYFDIFYEMVSSNGKRNYVFSC